MSDQRSYEEMSSFFDTRSGGYDEHMRQVEKEAAVIETVKPGDGGSSGQEGREFLAWVTQQWQLPFILNAEPMDAQSQKVHRLTFADGSRRYLKRMPSVERTRLEAAIHHALSESGVRTAAPLTARSGERWAQWGEHLYVLADEIRGTVKEAVGADEAVLYGRGLAKLHHGLSVMGGTGDYPEMYLRQQLEEWAIPRTLRLAGSPVEAGALEALGEEIASAWVPLLYQLPKQLIHRDPHPGNMVLAEDGTVGFLDFEISVIGMRMFDLCYFCTSQWIRDYKPDPDTDHGLNVVAALLKGYEEISPLSRAERGSAYYFMCVIQMIFTAYYHDQERPDLARVNLEALLGLLRNRGSIEKVFQ